MSQNPTPAEPVTWRVDGFSETNPFTANLVIDTTDSALTLSLDPASLNALHDALTLVRAAQRDAVLGAAATPVTDASVGDTADDHDDGRPAETEDGESNAETDPETGDNEPAPARRKVHLKTIALVALIGLVLYSLAAGAVLI